MEMSKLFFCALGDVTLSDSPASDRFALVAGYYNFEKELLQSDQRLFIRLKKHIKKSIKTATEVIKVLHENSLYEITSEFSKVAYFGRHSRNIMLSGTFVQRNPAKTYFRNTKGQHRLNSLSIISVLNAPMEIKSLSTIWTR